MPYIHVWVSVPKDAASQKETPQKLGLYISSTDPVSNLRDYIERALSIPSKRQALFFTHFELTHNLSLEQQGVTNNAVIELIVSRIDWPLQYISR